MAVTEFLIGKTGLQNQRDRAIDYAEERYDPAQLSPQVNLARQRATEGIPEGQEAQARRRTVESLFRPTDTSIYGGNQARAIAGQQQQNRQAQAGLADFESQLTRQDIQTRQQGQEQFAKARTQQRQMSAQRDAAIEEAEMQYEAELANRRKQMGQALGELAGTAVGAATGLGPLASAAGGAAGGALLGGGSGAVSGAGAGLSTAYSRQQSQDFINQLSGGQAQTQQTPSLSPETQQNMQFAQRLMDTQPQAPQRPSVPLQQPQDTFIPEDIDFGMGEVSDQPMQTAQQTVGDFNMVEDAQVRNLVGDLMDFEIGGDNRPPETEFGATGQYLGQGNLKGPNIMELLQGYFNQRNNSNATGQYLR